MSEGKEINLGNLFTGTKMLVFSIACGVLAITFMPTKLSLIFWFLCFCIGAWGLVKKEEEHKERNKSGYRY